MKRLIAALILLALLAPFAAGQKADREAELRSLVEAERTFARASVEKGTRAAFIENLADDSILFRPGPVPGKKWMEEHPGGKGVLTWQPVFADVSNAGDMGYTTGPWEFREKSLEDKPVAYGEFITIWKKQPDGKWKAFLDIGNQHAEPTQPSAATPMVEYGRSPQVKARADKEAGRAELLKTESELQKALTGKSGADPFMPYWADDLRLYRINAYPVLGKAAARTALAASAGTLTWQTVGGEVSSSGDLGYTYGSYELKGGPQDKPAEGGNFLRIWKKQKDGTWKMVLDNLHPITRPK